MKNLITDKPSTMTVALAQAKKGDSDTAFQFAGANFSKGSMKNLITDKPSPLTVALS